MRISANGDMNSQSNVPKREDQIFGKHMRRGWKRKMETGKIKLVAADMDGTLLNRDRKITKYTQDVIKKQWNKAFILFRLQEEL